MQSSWTISMLLGSWIVLQWMFRLNFGDLRVLLSVRMSGTDWLLAECSTWHLCFSSNRICFLSHMDVLGLQTFLWEACHDTTLIILMVAAVVSLAVSIPTEVSPLQTCIWHILFLGVFFEVFFGICTHQSMQELTWSIYTSRSSQYLYYC